MIDYDDTIVYQDFPRSGVLKPNAKEVINRLYDEGHRIIISTCRAEDRAETAKNYLVDKGVKFDKFNENLDWSIAQYKGDTRKISADVYIDDRNLGGIPDDWNLIYEMIQKQLKK